MQWKKKIFVFVYLCVFFYTLQPVYAKPDLFLLHVVVPTTASTLNVEPDTITLLENEPVILKLSVSDPLPGSYIFSVTPFIENASLNAFTGIYNFIPDFLQAGTYSLEFSARNGEQRLTQKATLTVDDNNRPPEMQLSFSDTLFVKENQSVEIHILAIDPDTDNTLVYSIVPDIPNMSINAETGDIHFQPDFSQAGTFPVQFRVTDGKEIVSASRTIVVQNVNRPPELILNPSTEQVIQVGQTFNLLTLATDPDQDPLTLRAASLPKNSTFSEETGRFTFIPALDQYRQEFEIVFTVSDATAEVSASIELEIEAEIDPLFDFEEEGNVEGWKALQQIDFLKVENGVLKGVSTGNDPILIRTGLHIDTFSQKELVVRAFLSTPSSLSFFFITSEGQYIGPGVIQVPASPTHQTFSLDFKDLFPQPKIIESLRVDPGFVENVFEIDFIGFRKTGIPTRTPTPNPLFTPTPTSTMTATATPQPATPTPTVTPTPTSTATPTSIPTVAQIDFDQNLTLENTFDVLAPTGFAPARVSIIEATGISGIDGNALLIRAAPGEGAFLVSKNSFIADKESIILSAVAFPSKGNPAFALIGFQSPIDGRLAFHSVTDGGIPTGKATPMNLIYKLHSPTFQVGLQVVNTHSDQEVFVIFDKVRAMPVNLIDLLDEGKLDSDLLATDPEGHFDGDLSNLITNINNVDGSVQILEPARSDQELILTVNEKDTAANAGVFFPEQDDLLPGTFAAEVFIGRYLGEGGTLAFAMGNGQHTFVVFDDTSDLAFRVPSKRMIIGGNFVSINPAIPPLTILQNARTSGLSSVLMDDLRLWKILADL